MPSAARSDDWSLKKLHLVGKQSLTGKALMYMTPDSSFCSGVTMGIASSRQAIM